MVSIESRILAIVPRQRRWAYIRAFEEELMWNVERILHDCYEALLEDPYCTNAPNPREFIGVIGTQRWDDFVFKVFEIMIAQDAFEQEDTGYLNNYDDPAGCKENVWFAACEALSKV